MYLHLQENFSEVDCITNLFYSVNDATMDLLAGSFPSQFVKHPVNNHFIPSSSHICHRGNF